MDGWDWVLWIAGGYLALTTLCQLMRIRRNWVLDELNASVARERRHQKAKMRKEGPGQRDTTGRAA